MMPPMLMSIAVNASGCGRRGIRLWLPVILIWPLLAVLYIIIFPIAAIAELGLQSRGIKPFSILIALLQLISALRGMDVSVKSCKSKEKTFVKIRIL